jgi:hypothetical protein
MCSNNPVQTALFAISDTNDLLFGEESYRYSKMKVLSKKGQKILHVAVVVDKGNLLHIFAVDTLHTLWLKRQKKYSSGPDIEFEDWVQLDSTVPLNRVLRRSASTGCWKFTRSARTKSYIALIS